ncbi:hypothetical protein [Subtercola endophyticus]|uniref:hypothetical protein n=1 Tax=Subtercola endophyticus TaxID=2895559 RepID=UPI001E38E375|nr:hypothetical protein [Subtercola endophyticus]UFS59465.1 hypothetical protein LQ955_01300 [Subtercola endophyticus]
MVWFANGLAPKSALVFYKGSYFSPSMFARVKWVDDTLAAQGVAFTINQGYRFLGVPADRAIGQADTSTNEALAHTTSTGDGNQWYQLGRQDNGSTPSAATPGTSNHGEWDIGAIDSNTNNEAARDAVMAQVGLARTISSESWHAAVTGNPSVNLDQETDDDMPLSDDDVKKVAAAAALAVFTTPINNANGEGTPAQWFSSLQERLAISVAALAVGHGTTAYVRDPNNTPAGDSPAWSSDVFAQMQRAMNDMRADINKILKALAAKQ